VIGLRPSMEGEEEGLDQTDHGEVGYHPDEEGAHGGFLAGVARVSDEGEVRAAEAAR